MHVTQIFPTNLTIYTKKKIKKNKKKTQLLGPSAHVESASRKYLGYLGNLGFYCLINFLGMIWGLQVGLTFTKECRSGLEHRG